MSDRDRKLLAVVLPLALVAGLWFLVLGPKRQEARDLDAQVSEARTALDGAQARVAQAEGARSTFAADYEAVVRLGKAIPAKVDMPSLLVQLESAARGTGVQLSRVVVGERTSATAPAAAAPAPAGQAGAPPAQPGSAPAQPGGDAAAGGAPAQTGAGRAAETAGNTVQDANAQAAQAGQTGSALPAAGAPAAGAAPAPVAGAAAAPGLESVPLDFTFRGGYFELADFLHRLKRFVHVGRDGQPLVRGRLLSIDQVSFKTVAGQGLEATIKASVYLAPKAEGTTAGATPAGPAQAPAPTQTAAPASGAPTPPTAARVP